MALGRVTDERKGDRWEGLAGRDGLAGLGLVLLRAGLEAGLLRAVVLVGEEELRGEADLLDVLVVVARRPGEVAALAPERAVL